MSIFYPACPSLTNEAWFNSTSVYDDESYIDALEKQAKAWKEQYECCGTTVQPIGIDFRAMVFIAADYPFCQINVHIHIPIRFDF